jgi:hypothetical protein
MGSKKGGLRWLIGATAFAVAVAVLWAIPSSRALADSFLAALRGTESEAKYDIVVYGGSFSGYAAVRMIQRENPGLRVLLIVPQRQLGEIGTAGAQNFWDLRGYSEGWIGGTFRELFEAFDRAYDPEAMAAFMADRLAFDPNVDIRYGTDIVNVAVRNGEVRSLDLQTLSRLPDGREIFESESGAMRVEAKIFIDASFNGRLLRLAGFTGITGREDYADRRQQAVTLMFEIEGLDFWKAVRSKDFESTIDKDGSRMLWGGDPAKHPKTWAFNDSIRQSGRLKPLNLAEGARDRYWVNVMLMYGVDATKEAKDEGTPRYPQNDLMTLDEGYAKLRRIVETDEFLEAIRDFPGFENVHITRFAPMLYVRESIHSAQFDRPGSFGFAMTPDEITQAGPGPESGADADHYSTRIGLQFYLMDTQGYIEHDPAEKEMESFKEVPSYPAYAPYDVLLNPRLKNVLVCGYGINASSVAWFALRVLPNQMVLGDAAGMAAAASIELGIPPAELARSDMAGLQDRLRRQGAILDKKPRTAPFGANGAPRPSVTGERTYGLDRPLVAAPRPSR